ncbi:MAG: transposase [Alphaproteobacteria bacterium]|nr:transposase [Alphaproteobacteria bacterium]MBM3653011.1 transposase [Alphaproteobacteria bacterium]
MKTKNSAVIDPYNHRRYHESRNNCAPAEVYSGRGSTILHEREKIKRTTIQSLANAK